MSRRTEVATFEASFSRKGLIALCGPGDTCHVCGGNDVASIAIDSSEDEYGPGIICFRCVRKLDPENAAGREVAP